MQVFKRLSVVSGMVRPGAAVRGLALVLALLALSVQARAEELGAPQQVVAEVTEQVLAVVREQGAKLDSEPEAFFAAIEEVLAPVVAFDFIARGVMGNYAKEASEEQRKRFSEVFQQDLVSTYARGLAIYSANPITVDPGSDAQQGQRRVSVIQRVKTDAGEHVLAYTMGLDRNDNRWKLLNVVINGVNLGNTFRSQFAQAMQKSGDLDSVIEGWGRNG
ncbi:phospholipid-binding protein MlaC [Pseudomaricurvus sp. HS19]|uniref:MlaC/ttg2D family ABC transporter substrate-binding protein n=1 Tax=Pseudomaricurvus sp. HS19 TaxID=2692626 RepID=UPI00136BB0FA|nr:ABC transporter substrate-binding protein [Pseudomaricurvus sp. HS19]MYM64637.1 ABC transporter substrate-binding protein [Pseudomaricurvus sp. HS19]